MTVTQPAQHVLEVEGLKKHFTTSHTMFARGRLVKAIDGISFRVSPGEIVALVGESGCGKTTVANVALGLLPPTAGDIRIDGTPLAGRSRRQLKAMRRRVQMIFQDPYESLNPLMTIEEIVGEPLAVHHIGRRKERRGLITEALARAGLSPPESFLQRRPHELSGGQRQRVVIAGAMVMHPNVLVADEPVSMLDVSIRAEILNLLRDLAAGEKGLGIVLITHDLSMLSAYADRIAVMYLGRIVEEGPSLDLIENPQHPYTKALLSVVPTTHPEAKSRRIILSGETPDPSRVPEGCRFHPRCPEVYEPCRTIDPAETVRGRHRASCHLLGGSPAAVPPV